MIDLKPDRHYFFTSKIEQSSPSFNLPPKEYELVFQKKYETYDAFFVANRYNACISLGRDFVTESCGLLIQNQKSYPRAVPSWYSYFERLECALYSTPKKTWIQTQTEWVEIANSRHNELQVQTVSAIDFLVRICAQQLGVLGLSLHENFERRIIAESKGTDELGYRIPKAGLARAVEPELEEQPRVISFNPQNQNPPNQKPRSEGYS